MVRVTTLGESRVKLRDINLTPASGLSFSIVLYLAAEAGRNLNRAAMRAMFWPGVPERIARHSLRQSVYMLRRTGGEVFCDGSHISLAAHTVSLDYKELGVDTTATPLLLL